METDPLPFVILSLRRIRWVEILSQVSMILDTVHNLALPDSSQAQNDKSDLVLYWATFPLVKYSE
jgi:hypothetical protein